MLFNYFQKLLSRKYPLTDDLKELNHMHFMEYIKLYAETTAESSDHLTLFNGESFDQLALFNIIENYLAHHKLIPHELLEPEPNAITSKKSYYGQEAVALIAEERKPELLELLLTNVDFAKLIVEHFLSGPGISKILNWQQKYFILSQLCTGEPMPTSIKLFENLKA